MKFRFTTTRKQESVYRAKSKYDPIGYKENTFCAHIFIPQTQEYIGCMSFLEFYFFFHRAVVFQPDVEHWIVCRLAPVLKTIFHQYVISYTCSQSNS